MAERTDDPVRAGALAIMAVIERQTKEQLAPLLDREGIERDDAPRIESGVRLGERSACADWTRFLQSFAPATGPALDRYRVMRDELAPEADRATMRALVTHEVVLQAFADRVLDGAATAIELIVDALEGDHRDEARRRLDAAPHG